MDNENRQPEINRLHAEACKVLAHPSRIEVIDRLQDSEKTAGELAGLMNLSKANLSQHLGIMRHSGIVKTRREGAHIYYRIVNPKVVQACRLMREVMLDTLTQNEQLVQSVRNVESK